MKRARGSPSPSGSGSGQASGSGPSGSGHGLLLRPPWYRPRAHSDSGIRNLGAALAFPKRVLNVPPTKRQSIAVPGLHGPYHQDAAHDHEHRDQEHRNGLHLHLHADTDCECGDWKEESCRRNVAELLARQVLDITTATTPPLGAQLGHAPLLVEDPPSTADEEDDDVLRVAGVAAGPAHQTAHQTAQQGVQVAPAARFPNELLNGSSGNLSSTKSAPATPVGDRLQASAASTSTSRRRAVGVPTVAPASSTPTLVPLPLPSPATSKARHKKFHRHFDSVSPDERVLNYYSCALISDILLQGHLYITSNYFAFYSNVFGYVTKLLIPTASVLRVSKEKTARIIPNAIGVATSEGKHVFGSLLSRDNTYKLMVQVWKSALGPPARPPQPLSTLPIAKGLKDEADSASASGDILQEDDDSSLSGDGGLGGPPPVPCPLEKSPIVVAASCKASAASSSASALAVAPLGLGVGAGAGSGAGSHSGMGFVPETGFGRSTRQSIILGASTALVAFLLLSTAFLFLRMARIQDQFRMQSGDNLYHLHARSASQVEEFLSTHLDQLAKVRKSLEALTMLIVSNDDDRLQHADAMVHRDSVHRDSVHRDDKQRTGQHRDKHSSQQE